MPDGDTKGRNPFMRRSGQRASAPPNKDRAAPEQLATRFLAELHSAFQQGQISRDTEAQSSHMFRSIGWNVEPQKLSAQVDREIETLGARGVGS